MKIIVDESPVGVGKTHRAIEMMTKAKGRYVFAAERVQGMDEIAQRIVKASMLTGDMPIIEKIYSGNHRPGNVARQIADLPNTMRDNDHVVALITHEGMMSSDFTGFEDWTLIVDEVPSMFAMHTYRTLTDAAFFEENYTLSPIEGLGTDSWRMVGLTARGAALDASSIAECDGHRYLHHFHRRCRDPRRGPVVDLEQWSDMAEPGKSWVWWSMFQPEQIESFAARYFLGNGFTKSLSFKLFDDPSIEWETFSDHGSRPLRHRDARIVYFSDRPTSLRYFTSEDGAADLGKIAQYIAQEASSDLFWSSNGVAKNAIAAHLGEGRYQRPRQAGTSLLMHAHQAAMFYAAKPSREVEQAVRGLDSSEADWVSTHEFETILQFVTRTSVRDVTSTAPVTLYVFNRDHANYLKDFFDAQPHITASMAKVDLDLSTQTKRAPGRKKAVLTLEEREAKAAVDREKRKLAMRERRAKVAA